MAEESTGALVINTYTGSGAIPVPLSTVRVRGADENNRFIEYSVLTDEDGVSPTISLPTPDVSYSLTPNPKEAPYSNYDIEVIKDGYYTKRIYTVPIFSGITSILPVAMLPYVPYKDGGKYPSGNVNARVEEKEFG